jgi:hypothetical protein
MVQEVAWKLERHCKTIFLYIQAIFSNLNWTCLLIPLKYMENQEQSGQVQLRLEKIACKLLSTFIYQRISYFKLFSKKSTRQSVSHEFNACVFSERVNDALETDPFNHSLRSFL